ncbi:MAG TPA: patatin-like phospholipase family protein [Actinophytocola sp.]|uniref:patatin-like phospholipase family protein n=1 Tax=Actinophytocola sp. TaxID=1872138 RepID=UPI002DB8E67D|nr:patatin-like phospholipase family protein [Actinophytocola sp.]HEU5471261.1 patatin-like phospholipase family protein [Actinophytocola sp.]
MQVLRDRAREGSEPGKRTDGYKVALAIEGGGNRGCVSAGMASALYEAGLLSTVDAVYGSSSGSVTAAWLLSSDFRRGVEAWAHADSFTPYANFGNLLRRRPFLDLERLMAHLFDRVLQLDYESILTNPISLHPLATDMGSGAAMDLNPHLRCARSLVLAILASSAWPLLTGPPVRLGGRRYLDAAIAEPVPLATPLAAGVTHLLVLRSRSDGHPSMFGSLRRHFGALWMRQYGTALWQAYHRGATSAAQLNVNLHNRSLPPTVLVVPPAADLRRLKSLESDHRLIGAALAAGRATFTELLRSHGMATVPAPRQEVNRPRVSVAGTDSSQGDRG